MSGNKNNSDAQKSAGKRNGHEDSAMDSLKHMLASAVSDALEAGAHLMEKISGDKSRKHQKGAGGEHTVH